MEFLFIITVFIVICAIYIINEKFKITDKMSNLNTSLSLKQKQKILYDFGRLSEMQKYESDSSQTTYISGTVKGCSVTALFLNDSTGNLRISIEKTDHSIFLPCNIKRFQSSIESAGSFTDDLEFDNNFIVTAPGNKLHALAVMTEPVRQKLLSVNQRLNSIEITTDKIEVEIERPTADKAFDILKSLQSIIEYLTTTIDMKEQLEQSIKSDSNHFYRAACLKQLDILSRLSEEYLLKLLHDKHEPIVLMAARRLGKKGIPGLQKIVTRYTFQYNMTSHSREVFDLLVNYSKNDKEIVDWFYSQVANSGRNSELTSLLINFLKDDDPQKLSKSLIKATKLHADEIRQSSQLQIILLSWFKNRRVAESFDWVALQIRDPDIETALLAIETLRSIEDFRAISLLKSLSATLSDEALIYAANEVISHLKKIMPSGLQGGLTISELEGEGHLSHIDTTSGETTIIEDQLK